MFFMRGFFHGFLILLVRREGNCLNTKIQLCPGYYFRDSYHSVIPPLNYKVVTTAGKNQG